MTLLLDTDIGSDIDDAICLAHLLAKPECDLLGITTVSGEPEKRAMLASAICRNAGRDVPILHAEDEKCPDSYWQSRGLINIWKSCPNHGRRKARSFRDVNRVQQAAPHIMPSWIDNCGS